MLEEAPRTRTESLSLEASPVAEATAGLFVLTARDSGALVPRIDALVERLDVLEGGLRGTRKKRTRVGAPVPERRLCQPLGGSLSGSHRCARWHRPAGVSSSEPNTSWSVTVATPFPRLARGRLFFTPRTAWARGPRWRSSIQDLATTSPGWGESLRSPFRICLSV